MKEFRLIGLLFVAALGMVWLSAAAVAADAPPGEDTGSAVEDWIASSKQPLPWLTWGADLRLREVFAANLLLNKEDRHFQRYRLRLWTTITPIKDVDINARLIYEPRHFCQPARQAAFRDGEYLDEWTLSEAVFDNLNVKWSNALGLPVDFTIGRQDIQFGNGWLVKDGSPLDGSRTVFLDAARATVRLEDAKTTIDLVYVDHHSESGYYLKPFCDEDYPLTEQDERGAIVYVTNKSLPDTQIDGYFIYKSSEQDLGSMPTDGVQSWQGGVDGDVYALGARLAGDVGENWKYRAEFAKEFGRKDGAPLCALGFNSRLEYHLNDKYKNNFRADYEYLSGDDPDTGKNEQFDPLWGRWPHFSEMLIYTAALENRVSEITNMHRFGVGWTTTPHEKLEFRTDYNVLFADQRDSYGSRAYFTGSSCFRGQLVTAWLTYKFNKHVSGHLMGELFFPGEFYSNAYNEVGAWVRYQIEFVW